MKFHKKPVQLPWILYCTLTHQWGPLPGVLLYTIIHARNLLKWESPAPPDRNPYRSEEVPGNSYKPEGRIGHHRSFRDPQ